MENSSGDKRHIPYSIIIGKGLLIFISSAIIIYTIKISNQIYLPTFVAGLGGLIIGWIEPKKGWILALIQTVIMISMYLTTGDSKLHGSRLELEMFTLIGSVSFIFIVSCGAAFIKRAE